MCVCVCGWAGLTVAELARNLSKTGVGNKIFAEKAFTDYFVLNVGCMYM